MAESDWRVLDPRSAITKARHLRVWHRHDDRRGWLEALASEPELLVDGERRHRTRYRCPCGAILDGEVPA